MKKAPNTVIQRILPSPTVTAEELGDARSKVKRKREWAQTAEVHTKGMNSVSQEVCIFPHREC